MPIVSAQETAELVSLLSVSDQTFAELSKRFKEAWPSAKEYFRLLCAVFLFLQVCLPYNGSLEITLSASLLMQLCCNKCLTITA